MLNLLAFLFFELPKPEIIEIDYCTKDISHLSEESRLEMGIACSYIKGRRVYKPHQIKRLYESK